MIRAGSQWRGRKGTGYEKFVASVNAVLLRLESPFVDFVFVTPKDHRHATIWKVLDFEKVWEPLPTQESTADLAENNIGNMAPNLHADAKPDTLPAHEENISVPATPQRGLFDPPPR